LHEIIRCAPIVWSRVAGVLSKYSGKRVLKFLTTILALLLARWLHRTVRSKALFWSTYVRIGRYYNLRYNWMRPRPDVRQVPGLTGPERVAHEERQHENLLHLAAEGRGRFVFDISADVVVRMGGRPSSKAQIKSARMLAGRLMKEHGHRPVHIVRDIPIVMSMILTPTAMERSVDAIINSGVVYDPSINNLVKLIYNGGYERRSDDC